MKYLSLLLLLCGCSSLQHGDKPETIRVLVYNIHAGKDAKGIDNLFRVGALILENRADIALLQEVDRFTTR
ncbi:MAG TPA: hypothetical protein VNJ04_15770, partial [Gemmatimonadaceae bacterium]|nr:hypothetical protein [Gemmatimonadaceae bacterium]